jgi:hypothetical protein
LPAIPLGEARGLVLIQQPFSVTSAFSEPMHTTGASQLADAATLRRVFLSRHALQVKNVVNPAQLASL